MHVRKAIEVAGIVQGVGFRPYVYRLAIARGLVGTIANTGAGVSIEVQGPAEAVEDFLERLPREAPPLARITSLQIRERPSNGDRSFVILQSHPGADRPVDASGTPETRSALISPDVAVCNDCLRELFDPSDRRYLYPFINCTNCGPRFTIVRDIPYDRARTSMNVFPMCPACQAEYDDPLNRRFHAQPNACWECGPQAELLDNLGQHVAASDPVAQAAARLREGAILAVKGLGGFHLACDASNAAAVETLRERKQRVEKPFAIMAPDMAAIESCCDVDALSRELLLRPERPIVLLPKKKPSPVLEGVAPFNRSLGVFLPYTPLHYLLFAAGQFPALVMTSGNLSEEPIAIGNQEALERLKDLADGFLVHNREILLRSDDSVVRVASGRVRQWRRSRGYVPVPVFLHKDVPPILAVGGELKNTVCLTRGRQAFLTQHIGDLENLESVRFFEEAIAHLQRILEIEPRIIAHDLHPDYFSTRWALARTGVECAGVQHHHAHIAACMAENHLEGRVIGIALDGTGYGTVGATWGGDILLAEYSDFERAAHLAYVPMPGGAAAIREPWRMAVSYLARHFGSRLLDLGIPFTEQLSAPQSGVKVLLSMIERGVNAPLTSSCGRLFDAVAALVGIRQRVNYEAQAAIELEMAIPQQRDGDDQTSYPFAVLPVVSAAEPPGATAWQIETGPLFEAIVRDLRDGVPAGRISRRFHNGLIEVFARVTKLLGDQTGMSRVCLSGGSMQNIYLLEHLEARLRAQGFQVFTHSEVPAGDGGLCLGQALVAAHRLAQKSSPETRDPTVGGL